MTDSTFTFRVDEELKDAFTRIAEDGERSAAQLLRLLMRQTVDDARATDDHHAWFRDAVSVGLAEADNARTELIDDDEVAARWTRRREQLTRSAAGRTA